MHGVLLWAGVAAALAVSVSDAEARGRRGGFGVFYVGSSSAKAGQARAAEPEAPPVIRTASAEDAPVPTTTGATPSPPPPVAAKPARPWCPSGRKFGSGTGFCEVN